MTTLEWILIVALGAIYICLLVTLAWHTYKKGRKVLFFVGFLLPVLWMIGAILPPLPGSDYERQQDAYWRERSKKYT
jgi:hypothetical protein